jgi:threonine aldolase
LLAKGRLLGVQFDALFTDKLYLNIGKNAIVQADRIRAALKAKGYPFAIASPTNQIFVVLDAAKKQALAQQVWFDLWDNLPDGRTVIRLCTSWATTSEAVDQLIALL